MTGRQLRFAVGSPESARSAIWKLWADKAEFYLCPRGADFKISMHSSGDWRVAWATGKVPAGLSKLMLRQPRPELVPPGMGRGPTVIIREESLIRHNGSAPRDTVWLPSPGAGHSTHVIVFQAPAGEVVTSGSAQMVGEVSNTEDVRMVVAAQTLKERDVDRHVWSTMIHDSAGARDWTLWSEQLDTTTQRAYVGGQMESPQAWLFVAELLVARDKS